MNDIEVLEDYINRYDIQDLDNEGIEFKNALENLLKERQSDKERIKDLEEINEAHKKENGELREELEEKTEVAEWKLEHAYNTGWKACEIISIPKSLIKEKIEELKEQFEDYGKRWEEAGMDKAHPFYKYLIRIEAEIDILEELLKGE